jgi:hypothetical protein
VKLATIEPLAGHKIIVALFTVHGHARAAALQRDKVADLEFWQF